MRERDRAVDLEAAEERRGDRRRHDGRERRVHRRARSASRARLPLVVHRVELAARTEIRRQRGGAAFELRAQPVARRVQHDRTADAEVRPQERAGEAYRDRPVDAQRQLDVVRDAGERRVYGVGRVEDERRERRRGGHDRVAEARGERVAGAVAAAPGERLPAGREHEMRRDHLLRRRDDAKLAGDAIDLEDALAGVELRADAARFAQQRLQHVARATRDRKQLAAGFLAEAHADLVEEPNGVGNRKRAQHAADDRRRAAPEVAFADRRVGDVAAAAAADEDLRAGGARALEQDERGRWVEAAREDRRREAGRARADDRDVADYTELYAILDSTDPRYARCHSIASRWNSAAKPRTSASSRAGSSRGFRGALAGSGAAAIACIAGTSKISSRTSSEAGGSKSSCSVSTASVGSDKGAATAALGGGAGAAAGCAVQRSAAQRSTRRRACGSRTRASAAPIACIASSSADKASAIGSDGVFTWVTGFIQQRQRRRGCRQLKAPRGRCTRRSAGRRCRDRPTSQSFRFGGCRIADIWEGRPFR